jgi:predicted GIY-YIG superfamily endonuclease
MNIKGYEFKGPFNPATNFKNIGAVYVVTDVNNSPVDVGQTNDLKSRIPSHERQECWKRNAQGGISIYARVDTSEQNRLQIENIIRNSFKFTCGVF